MALVIGGRHFGQYTHEHWFDHEYEKSGEDTMNKAETAERLYDSYNCAQSVLSAYAADYKLNREAALRIAAGFGAGMGRVQETCGAVSGAVMVLGLASGFREEDGRDKIGAVYEKVHRFIDDFTEAEKTIKCRELLGCNLSTDEGRAFFKEHNLRANCCGYIRLCCEMLDAYLKENV